MAQARLGDLLIKNGLITQEQFDEALEMQKSRASVPIGQLLCQLGYISESDLSLVLDFNKKRLKLGEILVRQKLIDQAKLDNALEIAKTEKIPVGKALLRLHYIEEEQLARAISSQYDVPFVALDNFVARPEYSQFVNANYAMRHRVVIIEIAAEEVTLAMAFPLSNHVLNELENLIHIKIRPVVARESDVVRAIEKLYGVQRRDPGKQSEEISLDLIEDLSAEELRSKYVLDHNVEYLVKLLLTTGVSSNASDIHLESTAEGLRLRFRIDGVLQAVDMGESSTRLRTHGAPLVSKLKILCNLDIAEKRRPQDGSFRVKVARDDEQRNVDFRVSVIPTKYGENAVIRILDKKGPMSLESLDLSGYHIEELATLLEKPSGMFLVTGPTGSGKTSTLYGILGKLNKPGDKTLTVEDPIEYTIAGVSQSEVNYTIGNDFAELLRAFLRQDPDHIMVGEVRDLETASIAVRAALTGHTVLSTLHTNDSTSTVSRLVDMGLEPTLVSSTLRCVISQRLIRTLCSLCTEEYLPDKGLLDQLGMAGDKEYPFFKGKGCVHCNFTGFSGRRPIMELWSPSREEALLINKNLENQALRQEVFAVEGRKTMLEDGLERVFAGETTLEELIRVLPFEQVTEFKAKREKMSPNEKNPPRLVNKK